MRIQALDLALANKIAAGEVVERPLSVVKELVENSLDAGATRIEVSIEAGGVKLIQVHDNGSGIHPDDLLLSVERHATSKIHNYDDLLGVKTLGFRGEALASIAAVSRLTLVSALAGAQLGYAVRLEGGTLEAEITPKAHPPGTTISVRDLFYNTPARRKFLASSAREAILIENTLRRLALSHFEVSFCLHVDGKRRFDSPAASERVGQERRVSSVLGAEFLRSSFWIEFEVSNLKLSGWIATPSFTRSQADMQYFYLNGRFVKDKVVAHAVREAYHDVLFHGRHPAYVLYLDIDPTRVDVNVHPTKHEVRFRESSRIHDFIRRGVHDALKEVRPADVLGGACANERPLGNSATASSGGQAVGEAAVLEPIRSGAGVSLLERPPTVGRPYAPVQERIGLTVSEQVAAYQKLHPKGEDLIKNTDLLVKKEDKLNHPLGYAIAQLHDIYILAQNEQGLVMVDMHAAHERILYEQMKRAFESEKIAMQPLLLPESLSLSVEEMQAFDRHGEGFSRLGFEIDVTLWWCAASHGSSKIAISLA